MAIESILPSDSGKVAFEKSGRNFELMDDKINVLENDRGYVNTKVVDGDWNNIQENGKYLGFSMLNAPTNGSTYFVGVITQGAIIVVQVAYCGFGPGDGNMYIRHLIGGAWTDWKQLATTAKTDILFPYNSGYTTQATHIRNGIVVENNHIYVYINVRKLDGSDVAAGSTIGILPPNCRPDKEIWGTIYLRDYTACYVIITPDGKVIIGGTTDSQYFIGCIDYYI